MTGPFSPTKVLRYLQQVEKAVNMDNMFDLHPVTVEIMPSNHCNHSCIECTFKDRHNSDEIPSDMLMTIVDDLAASDVKGILWTGGGEPLTYKDDLLKVMRRAHTQNLKQGLYTNGSLLTKKMSELIVNTFRFIRISIDAGNHKTHKVIHRSDDFETILCNIEYIVALKRRTFSPLTIGVSYLVFEENANELMDAALLARRLGVDYFQVKPSVSSNDQITPKYLTKIRDVLRELTNLSQENFQVIPIWEKFDYLESVNFGRNYSVCWGHSFVTTIGADAYLYPCCHLIGARHHAFGNLRKESFNEVWFSKRRQAIISGINTALCPPNCKLHDINRVLQAVSSSGRLLHPEFL